MTSQCVYHANGFICSEKSDISFQLIIVPRNSSHADLFLILISAANVFTSLSFFLFMRKPVFGVFDQVRLKLACSLTETS